MPVAQGVPVPTPYVLSWQSSLRQVFLEPMVRETEAALASSRDWLTVLSALSALPVDVSPATQVSITTHFNRLRAYHRLRFARAMRPWFGGLRSRFMFTDARIIQGIPTDLFSDPGIGPIMDQAVRDFVDLIVTIPARHHAVLKRDILKVQTAAPFDQNQLRDILANAHRVSGYNLRRLVRDQTNKTIGKFSETRQVALGIRQYLWSTASDERVRRSHAEKEGNVYAWGLPPPDTGHPGEDINCRCIASPIIGQQRQSPVKLNKRYVAQSLRRERRAVVFNPAHPWNPDRP